MISGNSYLNAILHNAPRLLGLLNRNISSSNYGCFDRDFWHYNTVDIACARKQEAALTLTLLYSIENEDNKYYHKVEILEYIRAALRFWTKIQNKNGSFNEWYPNEHSFVVTAFSTYAVSETLLRLKEEIPGEEYHALMVSLKKAGNWLISRNETRVMNQQTGAVIALLNLYVLTNDERYLNSSKDKISLLSQKQSGEGWFVEYGGPDIGYLSLAIDYLCKYYQKTKDERVKVILDRSLSFIKGFIQPDLIAGGEYTSRNTEYLIPHGFEIMSKISADAQFIASVIRNKIHSANSFPHLFDDRYLTYNGYTWLQAYMDANPDLDKAVEENIKNHFDKSFTKYYDKSGLLIINDPRKHFIVNVKKGGAFRIFDKTAERTYSDSGILVEAQGKWFTSGWLSSENQYDVSDDTITVRGAMWKVSDKTLSTYRYILLRLFQITFGRSSLISLWLKERLRDILITKTGSSAIKYERKIMLKGDSEALIKIKDSVHSPGVAIARMSVFARDTHIYVPSSRYYTGLKGAPLQKTFSPPTENIEIDWKIGGDSAAEFTVN